MYLSGEKEKGGKKNPEARKSKESERRIGASVSRRRSGLLALR